MTKVYKYEEFRTNSGELYFIEQYADAPSFAKFWRYGRVIETQGRRFTYVDSDYLLSKPNKRRLILNY